MRRTPRKFGSTSLGLALAVLVAACGTSNGAIEPATSAGSVPDASSAETPVEADEPAEAAETAPPDSNDSDDSDGQSDTAETATEPYSVELAGGATLVVPAGAPRGITATPTAGGQRNGWIEVASFELEPSGLVFDDPVELTVPLPSTAPNSIEAYSAVLVGDDGVEEFVTGTIDDEGTATVEIDHFSRASVWRKSADQPSAISSVTIGEPVEFGMDFLSELPGPPRFEVPSGSDQFAGVAQVSVDRTIELTCLAPGLLDGVVVLEARTDGEVFGGQVRLAVTCEAEPSVLQVASDEVENIENHSDKTLLIEDAWFSAWQVFFAVLDGGMAAALLDGGCDGPGADDVVVFAPQMILPDGSAVLGLERFGCYSLLVFPDDADVSMLDVPFVLDGPPTMGDGASWTVPGQISDAGGVFVVDAATGEPAGWTVTGTDGEMPRRP